MLPSGCDWGWNDGHRPHAHEAQGMMQGVTDGSHCKKIFASTQSWQERGLFLGKSICQLSESDE